MRVKMVMATAVIAISGVFATGASAAERTPTKVTIKAEGGDFYGYVKSEDPASCADGRKVILYKLKGGGSPDPSTDEKIGMDTASANGPKYMWSTGNTGQQNGKFYARVKRTEDCGGDLSKVVRAQG